MPGGSTSIALIGDAPDMSQPLTYGKNPSDEIVYPFLYRGLIRYNPEDDIAREDIAQCDISKIEKPLTPSYEFLKLKIIDTAM